MPRKIEIVWTQAALDDLNEILVDDEFSDDPNPLEETVFFRVSQLQNQPLLGTVFAPLGKPFRHLVIHPNYRLIYVPRDQQIFVMAFVHTRRKFRVAWRERHRPIG